MNYTATISIFTENIPGMLQRVTTVFTKRKQNIESITASESEIPGIHRYTIVIKSSKEQAKTIVNHLEKQVDVLKAFVHYENEIVWQEIALYKVPTVEFVKHKEVEAIIRQNNARILTIETDFVIIEKTGHNDETKQLYETLIPYGLLEFVRSGRVAISKPMKTLKQHINELKNISKSGK